MSRAGAAGGWTAGSWASILPTTLRPYSYPAPPPSPTPCPPPPTLPSPCPRHRVPDIFSDQAFIFLKVKTEQKKKYKETSVAAYLEARVVGLRTMAPAWARVLGLSPMSHLRYRVHQRVS